MKYSSIYRSKCAPSVCQVCAERMFVYRVGNPYFSKAFQYFSMPSATMVQILNFGVIDEEIILNIVI